MKLPTIHSGGWDPVFPVCNDTGVTLCMHIGSSSTNPSASPDAPGGVGGTLAFNNSMASLADWLFSAKLIEFPKLKLAYSEGQIGWIPYALERADTVWEQHDSWQHSKERIPEPPSTYYYGRIFGCFTADYHGLHSLAEVGEDNICFETDYPHTDTTWPTSKEYAEKMLADFDEKIAYKVLRGNAIKMLELDRGLRSPRGRVRPCAGSFLSPHSPRSSDPCSWSRQPARPRRRPDRPRAVSVATSDHAATVAWVPPASNGGASITGYRISSEMGVTDVGASVRSAKIDLGENGAKYHVTVAARNSVGLGQTRGADAVPRPNGVLDVGPERQRVRRSGKCHSGSARTLLGERFVHIEPSRSGDQYWTVTDRGSVLAFDRREHTTGSDAIKVYPRVDQPRIAGTPAVRRVSGSSACRASTRPKRCASASRRSTRATGSSRTAGA